MAEKLKKHASKHILGIRGEDIKFDPQNIDVYKDNKMHFFDCEIEEMIEL